ncbi:MAG: GNAT family protein [Saprospiraceae bacterium]|nr:GNAT family protein [Saprospiraceae bacterium]
MIDQREWIMSFQPIEILRDNEHLYVLKRWEEDDIEALLKYANNEKISGNLTDKFPFPYTRESGEEFIKTVKDLDPPRILCISNSREAIGAIGVHPQSDIWSRNMEMGYWLAEPFWGRGIITKAVEAMVTHGFNSFDVDRIFARPFGSNEASQRVLEKAGFTLEARFKNTIYKNGQYHDELIYAIRK